MKIHMSNKLLVTLISFAIAFILVMFLFIKKPHIVKSKNKYIRAVMVFAIAFVPGVMAASICAKTITTVWDRFFDTNNVEVICEDDDEDEENRKQYQGGEDSDV